MWSADGYVFQSSCYLGRGWGTPNISGMCHTFRATPHLCVKRERPLIITCSLYSENIMHYHFYLKHVRGEERSAQTEKLASSQL